MKKLRTLLLTTVLVMATAMTSFAGEITVKVNGSQVNFPDVKPYTDQNDRTLVPIRFIADNLGAETSWNEEKQVATIKKDDKTIDICIRCKKIFVNGKQVKTDSIGEKKDDIRTMVPLRFISEMFGAKVGWDEKTLTVTIDTDAKPEVPQEEKEILKSELPKELADYMTTKDKCYNGAGIKWDVRVDYADKTHFNVTSEPFPYTTYNVIFTDGTIINSVGGGSFNGNHIGKTIDKIFVAGENWKSYYVDIDDITIKESK
ncbi:copper amine oxidase N-terminal domain-containing protein [Filifactor alocis]|uniref:copper amine oxidase N-terminal domain-containing protein n=1 Tax=Filifactor alocis TaxID=143361 RepID=UPI0028ED2ACD|nr:copper amine oxidase N-terminal domain-containing protein [Filifactor alocis]